jgi:hypothetical protein
MYQNTSASRTANKPLFHESILSHAPGKYRLISYKKGDFTCPNESGSVDLYLCDGSLNWVDPVTRHSSLVCDLIVVGGGPAGSVFSKRVLEGKNDFSVVIVDPHKGHSSGPTVIGLPPPSLRWIDAALPQLRPNVFTPVHPNFVGPLPDFGFESLPRISDALLSDACAQGAQFITGKVKTILQDAKSERAMGVELVSGERLFGSIIVDASRGYLHKLVPGQVHEGPHHLKGYATLSFQAPPVDGIESYYGRHVTFFKSAGRVCFGEISIFPVDGIFGLNATSRVGIAGFLPWQIFRELRSQNSSQDTAAREALSLLLSPTSQVHTQLRALLTPCLLSRETSMVDPPRPCEDFRFVPDPNTRIISLSGGLPNYFGLGTLKKQEEASLVANLVVHAVTTNRSWPTLLSRVRHDVSHSEIGYQRASRFITALLSCEGVPEFLAAPLLEVYQRIRDYYDKKGSHLEFPQWLSDSVLHCACEGELPSYLPWTPLLQGVNFINGVLAAKMKIRQEIE